MSGTRSDGAGKPQPLTQSKNIQFPWSFTPDGKRLAFHEARFRVIVRSWTVPLESDGAGLRAGKPEVLLANAGATSGTLPSLRTGGGWPILPTSRGRTRFMCGRFRTRAASGRSRTAAASYPMWSRNGRELFFETLDNRIMVAAYTVKGDSFVADKPRLWSEKKIGGTRQQREELRSRAGRQAHRRADAGRGSRERSRRRTT